MSSEFVILSDSVNVFFFLKKNIIKCHFFIFYHCAFFHVSVVLVVDILLQFPDICLEVVDVFSAGF